MKILVTGGVGFIPYDWHEDLAQYKEKELAT
jgi:hypothetical protein